jgi:hypothetical protein
VLRSENRKKKEDRMNYMLPEDEEGKGKKRLLTISMNKMLIMIVNLMYLHWAFYSIVLEINSTC